VHPGSKIEGGVEGWNGKKGENPRRYGDGTPLVEEGSHQPHIIQVVATVARWGSNRKCLEIFLWSNVPELFKGRRKGAAVLEACPDGGGEGTYRPAEKWLWGWTIRGMVDKHLKRGGGNSC